jgi:hypothetical protein
MNQLRTLLSLALLIGTQWVGSTRASEVWTGPKITYSKAPSVNPMQAANQDRITSNVWLTRASSQGLFNAKSEANYVLNYSPADTEWAVGTTADIGSLTFQQWRAAIDEDPPSSVGKDMVLHLISDDIFIDIKFLSWGIAPNSGGYFSYERSTPVPELATAGLVLLGVMMICPLRPHRGLQHSTKLIAKPKQPLQGIEESVRGAVTRFVA